MDCTTRAAADGSTIWRGRTNDSAARLSHQVDEAEGPRVRHRSRRLPRAWRDRPYRFICSGTHQHHRFLQPDTLPDAVVIENTSGVAPQSSDCIIISERHSGRNVPMVRRPRRHTHLFNSFTVRGCMPNTRATCARMLPETGGGTTNNTPLNATRKQAVAGATCARCSSRDTSVAGPAQL